MSAKNRPMPLKVDEAFGMAGRVVIVTGAAGNVGGGIADVFAANGAKVVLSDLASERLSEVYQAHCAAGHEVAEIACDLANPTELKALVDGTLARYGKIDAVVNCGAVPKSGTITEEDVADFDKLYHTNVRAIWLLTKYCVEPMSANGGGSIVNISSVNGHRAMFFCSLYTGTKAAVLAMTKELAVELAPHGIRINSVSPGVIPNPRMRLQWLMEHLHEPWASEVKAEFLPKLDEVGVNAQPIQMSGHGHDVGMACYYLCTPAARFVTGEDILVDGGKLMEMHDAEHAVPGAAAAFLAADAAEAQRVSGGGLARREAEVAAAREAEGGDLDKGIVKMMAASGLWVGSTPLWFAEDYGWRLLGGGGLGGWGFGGGQDEGFGLGLAGEIDRFAEEAGEFLRGVEAHGILGRDEVEPPL